MNEEASKRAIQQILDIFVLPEIKRRQELGEAEKPFPLQYAQIIFYPDGTPSEVRLNNEVKTELKVVLKKEYQRKHEKGEPIYWGQIERIESTRLTDEDDPNAGHATLINFSGSWFLYFDFKYNKERASKHLKAAQQFVDAARAALGKAHWSVFIDSLCSASELTAKAYLLSSPDKTIIKSKRHGVVASKTNKHKKLGNLERHHVDAFNKVWSVRGKARYLEGELDINEKEANDLLENIEGFIVFVNSSYELESKSQ